MDPGLSEVVLSKGASLNMFSDSKQYLAAKGGGGQQKSVKPSEIWHLSKIVSKTDQYRGNTRQRRFYSSFIKTYS